MKKVILKFFVLFLIISCQSHIIDYETFTKGLKYNRFILDITNLVNVDDKSKSIIKNEIKFDKIITKFNNNQHDIIILLDHTDRFKFGFLSHRIQELKKYLAKKNIDTLNTDIYFLFDDSMSKYNQLKHSRVIIIDKHTAKRIE